VAAERYNRRINHTGETPMGTTGAVFILLSVLAARPQVSPPAQASKPIQCELRVFDGSDEVTRETRVRVYPSGRKENGVPTDAAGRVQLLPGLYDVQMIRQRDGQVTGTRWIEHLLIMRYPDEEGHHLEVANFKPQYGALELKTGGQADYDADAFAAGDHSRPTATGKRGAGYVLLVVPAGRYDVRVKAASSNAPETWLTDIDIPADRTRLRTVGAGRQKQE
jgi:hypothetical protein